MWALLNVAGESEIYCTVYTQAAINGSLSIGPVSVVALGNLFVASTAASTLPAKLRFGFKDTTKRYYLKVSSTNTALGPDNFPRYTYTYEKVVLYVEYDNNGTVQIYNIYIYTNRNVHITWDIHNPNRYTPFQLLNETMGIGLDAQFYTGLTLGTEAAAPAVNMSLWVPDLNAYRLNDTAHSSLPNGMYIIRPY